MGIVHGHINYVDYVHGSGCTVPERPNQSVHFVVIDESKLVIMKTIINLCQNDQPYKVQSVLGRWFLGRDSHWGVK